MITDITAVFSLQFSHSAFFCISSCLKHLFCLSHLSFSLYVTLLLSLPHHFSSLCPLDLFSLIIPLFINLPPSLLSAPYCISHISSSYNFPLSLCSLLMMLVLSTVLPYLFNASLSDLFLCLSALTISSRKSSMPVQSNVTCRGTEVRTHTLKL